MFSVDEGEKVDGAFDLFTKFMLVISSIAREG